MRKYNSVYCFKLLITDFGTLFFSGNIIGGIEELLQEKNPCRVKIIAR